MTVFPLASEFPPVTREDWLAKVEAMPSRVSYDQLRSNSEDGIIIEPLYEAGKGQQRFERSSPDGRWVVAQRVDHPVPARANEFALDDLEGGATGFALTFNGAASARGYGVAADPLPNIAGVFRNVPLHAVSLRLEPGPHTRGAASAVRSLVAARSLNPQAMRLSFGMDPVGLLASAGGALAWKEASCQASDLVSELAVEYSGPFMEADGRPYHDGGATDAQELGIVLATVLAYFRALEDRLSGEALPGAIGVTLSVDCDLFLGIAKLRAMRQLWRGILGGCALPASPLMLHAESSWRMMAAQDANMNLLRAVAAAFAAGIGGADSVTVLPHTLALGLPDGFARRMARNLQIVLLEEAQLYRVGDPASGSGYVEALTQAVAGQAWGVFQDIEKRGGMAAALDSGYVRNLVRDANRSRIERVAARQRPIVGVSEFANPADPSPAVLDVPRKDPPAGESSIRATRLSETFERPRNGVAAGNL